MDTETTKNEFFVSLKNDYAFVQCMKNPVVLQGFLSAVMKVPVRNIWVKDRHLEKTDVEGIDYFYSCFHLREDKTQYLYSDMMEVHVIELRKLVYGSATEDAELYKWACFINAESEEERMLVERDPYVKELERELEKSGKKSRV